MDTIQASYSPKEYLIGTGGWAYFHVPRLKPLEAYSRVFSFVEVNSTFYQIPDLKEVENWRKSVPQHFQFAVRTHRSIASGPDFRANDENLDTLDKMKQICTILRADIMHLQTPSSFVPTNHSASGLRDLVTSSNPDTQLALEIRGASQSSALLKLYGAMNDLNIIHCTDLSKGEMPAYKSDTLYSRLFGKGEHNIYQPTDEELAEVDNKASSGGFKKVVLSFHFVRMYKDAVRLKIYKQTGSFPKVTGTTGFSSLGEVLAEDAHFPSTKQELVKSQGWKLFDLTNRRRARADEFLQQLPPRVYSNTEDIVNTLESMKR